VCSSHKEYFDLPPCFPRLPLGAPDEAAKVVARVIANGKDVFENQAAHARSRNWAWFVSFLKMEKAKIQLENTRSRLAVIYDSPNWAFHRIALQIQKHLDKTHDITMHPYTSLWDGLLADCDYVINLALLGADRVKLAMGGNGPQLVTCVYDHYSWQEPKNRALFSRAVETSDMILCANENLVRAVSVAYPNASLSTCVDGVDSKMFSPNEHPDCHTKLRVGWAGNSGHDNGIKRLHLLQEAIGNVDNAELVLADSVLSPVSYEDMPEWYRSIDVLCCTSVSEGTPNPVLEAASSGVSFISTDVGIVSHLGRSADGCPGVIFQGSTREQIVCALTREIQNLANNRELVAERGAVARLAIEHGGWAWESRVLQFVDTLDLLSE